MKRNFVLVCLLVGLVTITSAQKWVGTQHTLSAAMGWSTMLGELGGGPGIPRLRPRQKNAVLSTIF